MNFIISFIFSFIVYLLLTIGSGDILYWSQEEVVIGIILSIVSGLIVQWILNLVKLNISLKFLNPLRWVLFLIYAFGPFLFNLLKANIIVAYRILTKKINPKIVKISPNLKTDFGIVLLANSITLTPGTLSVDIDKDNNLYIHLLWQDNKDTNISEIAGSFPKWIKRITE
ncbi:MAG: Na+/H+ antiporter subunit E [Patescibacteria group bacterium]|nr:Na+/H+ antiporter subunit E [Patescibacteria group bacterium]